MARHPLLNSEQQRLWERIKGFRLDEGQAAFPFPRGWRATLPADVAFIWIFFSCL